MDRKRQIEVKMGEYRVGKDGDVLSAQGLGSCVAVCLYDEDRELGGLAHVMLPEGEDEDSDKYAENIIHDLMDEIREEGSGPEDLIAKIFGGAHVVSETINVGDKNVESVRKILKRMDIDLRVQEVGGDTGRSIWLNCRSGKVVVRKPFEATEIF
ncbi:MAG: chemotaxis protein CheD [Candidatus Nanohaloarchaea archaeon]